MPPPTFARLRRMRRASRSSKGKGVDHEAWRRALRDNATWWDVQRPHLAKLRRRNSLDEELFAFAAERFRTQLDHHWSQRGYGGPAPVSSTPITTASSMLPPLPCASGGQRCLWKGGTLGAETSVAL